MLHSPPFLPGLWTRGLQPQNSQGKACDHQERPAHPSPEQRPGALGGRALALTKSPS